MVETLMLWGHLILVGGDSHDRFLQQLQLISSANMWLSTKPTREISPSYLAMTSRTCSPTPGGVRLASAEGETRIGYKPSNGPVRPILGAT